MIWTAEVAGKETRVSGFWIRIKYTSDSGEVVYRDREVGILTQEVLQDWMKADTAALEGAATIANVGDVIQPKADTIIPPTDAEVKRDAFLGNLYLYQRYLRAIDLGLVAANDQAVVDLQKQLQDMWSVDYLDAV